MNNACKSGQHEWCAPSTIWHHRAQRVQAINQQPLICSHRAIDLDQMADAGARLEFCRKALWELVANAVLRLLFLSDCGVHRCRDVAGRDVHQLNTTEAATSPPPDRSNGHA